MTKTERLQHYRQIEEHLEMVVQVVNATGHLDADWDGELIYLMRLHPEGRFKIGYAGNRKALDGRWKAARTWVPEATLVKAWMGKYAWESKVRDILTSDLPIDQAAIDRLFQGRSSHSAGDEVIDGGDEAVLVKRADELFHGYLYPLLEKEDDA